METPITSRAGHEKLKASLPPNTVAFHLLASGSWGLLYEDAALAAAILELPLESFEGVPVLSISDVEIVLAAAPLLKAGNNVALCRFPDDGDSMEVVVTLAKDIEA